MKTQIARRGKDCPQQRVVLGHAHRRRRVGVLGDTGEAAIYREVYCVDLVVTGVDIGEEELAVYAQRDGALGGRLVNGYISGARVYQDQDGDGVYDVGEPSVITGTDGSYELTIVDGGGSLIAEPLSDTVDQSTGASVTSQFSAPSGATVISPISTLVDAGLSASQVKTALGIDSSIDRSFDRSYDRSFARSLDRSIDRANVSTAVIRVDILTEWLLGVVGFSAEDEGERG